MAAKTRVEQKFLTGMAPKKNNKVHEAALDLLDLHREKNCSTNESRLHKTGCYS